LIRTVDTKVLSSIRFSGNGATFLGDRIRNVQETP
jgi:hypothetical protein